MPVPPTLHTDRLILRPFTPDDAPLLPPLVGDFAMADTTLAIPHPYTPDHAESWIASHEALHARNKAIIFAVVLRSDWSLIGAINLNLNDCFRHAEMGYWIAALHWGQGYCTEAARALIAHGFATCNLHRIFATHLARNPASGRVMQKLGMKHEGTLRQHIFKWDKPEDLEQYGILRAEWRP